MFRCWAGFAWRDSRYGTWKMLTMLSPFCWIFTFLLRQFFSFCSFFSLSLSHQNNNVSTAKHKIELTTKQNPYVQRVKKKSMEWFLWHSGNVYVFVCVCVWHRVFLSHFSTQLNTCLLPTHIDSKRIIFHRHRETFSVWRNMNTRIELRKPQMPKLLLCNLCGSNSRPHQYIYFDSFLFEKERGKNQFFRVESSVPLRVCAVRKNHIASFQIEPHSEDCDFECFYLFCYFWLCVCCCCYAMDGCEWYYTYLLYLIK